MTQQLWINIGLRNGLLPDGTKPLPKPLLNSYIWLVKCSGIHVRSILEQVIKLLFCAKSLKITRLKSLPHLPGANELTIVENNTSYGMYGERVSVILERPMMYRLGKSLSRLRQVVGCVGACQVDRDCCLAQNIHI